MSRHDLGKKLTVGSLFSGIGGIDLGLERAGMQIVWQVEINPFCQQILKKHWPEAVLYDNITTLRGSELPSVEVLAGGFPCQDVSMAGKRAGMGEGTRSGLWAEYARLIGEIEPRWVIIENVPGLLSIDAGRGMGKVLHDLSIRGYAAEWDCISEASVGALHRRDRIFIIAHSERDGRKERLQSDADEGRRCPSFFGDDGAAGYVADTMRRRLATPGAELQTAGASGRGEDVADSISGGCQRQDVPVRSRRSHEENALPTRGGQDVADADRDSFEGHEDSRFGQFDVERNGQNVPFTEGRDGGCRDVRRDGLEGYIGPFERGRQDNTLGTFRDASGEWWAAEPDVGRVAYGVPARVDRLRALGNAVVPQVAEYVGRLIVEAERSVA